MNIDHFLESLLPSEANLITSVAFIGVALLGIAFLLWTYDHKQIARYVRLGIIALIGLMAWAIAVFDQFIPLNERAVWFGIGIELAVIGGLWLTSSLKMPSRIKSKRSHQVVTA